MKPITDVRVKLGLFAALLVLGFSAWANYTGSSRLETAFRDVTTTQGVVDALKSLQSALTRMESDQRGYAVTGNPEFLEGYRSGAVQVEKDLALLSQVAMETHIRELADSLEAHVGHKIDFMQQSLDLRDSQGREAALALIQSGVGREEMGVVRNYASRIQVLESTALNNRLRSYDRTYRRSATIMIWQSMVAGTLLLIISIVLLRDISHRRKAESQLRTERAQVEEFIRNAPIPLILFEADGSIISFSRRWKQEFNEHAADLRIGASFPECHPILCTHLKAGMEQVRGGSDVSNAEDHVDFGDGHVSVISWHMHPLANGSGGYRVILAAYRINELVEARQKAIEASDAKSGFLARVSHELRTPLNAVLGYAQILKKSTNLAPEEQGYIDTMFRSGNHLLNMINDILDLSKIEAGKIELNPTHFAMQELLHDLQSMFNLRCREKGIRLVSEFQDPMPGALYGDAQKLRQLLINLVGNAVKFTQAGTVTIRFAFDETETGIRLRFDVADTGPGIPPDALDHLFQPFAQVKGRYSEGTGLGLAISLKLAHLMDGELSVQSIVGEGSVFTATVTMQPSDQEPTWADSHLPEPVALEGDARPVVLIVDDIAPNREVARILLERIGFDVHEAADGREGIERWRELQPAVVLMDIVMPVLDGVSCMKAIRAEAVDPVVIIALTASGFDGKNQELIALGFDEYVRKPFQERYLLDIIGRLAGIRYRYAGDAVPAAQAAPPDHDAIAGFIASLPESDAGLVRNLLLTQEFDILADHLTTMPDSAENRQLQALLRRGEFYPLDMITKRLTT